MQTVVENSLTPKLRFREFNKGWRVSKIQSLLDEDIIISHLDGNHGGCTLKVVNLLMKEYHM